MSIKHHSLDNWGKKFHFTHFFLLVQILKFLRKFLLLYDIYLWFVLQLLLTAELKKKSTKTKRPSIKSLFGEPFFFFPQFLLEHDNHCLFCKMYVTFHNYWWLVLHHYSNCCLRHVLNSWGSLCCLSQVIGCCYTSMQ